MGVFCNQLCNFCNMVNFRVEQTMKKWIGHSARFCVHNFGRLRTRSDLPRYSRGHLQTNDVNRVPGPGKTTWTRVSKYPKATRKFLKVNKSYSEKKLWKRILTGPIQNIKLNINTAKIAECCNKYVNNLPCTWYMLHYVMRYVMCWMLVTKRKCCQQSMFSFQRAFYYFNNIINNTVT